MPCMLVRYRAKPDKIEENERLIREVFRELHGRAPEDVRYLVLRLDDGTFYHLVEDGSRRIPSLDAFAAFRRGGDSTSHSSWKHRLSATIVCLLRPEGPK
jgi:hypothetical protein